MKKYTNKILVAGGILFLCFLLTTHFLLVRELKKHKGGERDTPKISVIVTDEENSQIIEDDYSN